MRDISRQIERGDRQFGVRDGDRKDYPGSHPRGVGLLHPAITHYNVTMCTDYNDGVDRYAILMMMPQGLFEASL
jgi:hypothetical protein